jgi:hypothetical protein
MPAGLMQGWRRLFGALHRQGYPDGALADQGEAWARFREGLPAALLRQRSLSCPDPALALVAEWLTAEFIAGEAMAHGLVAVYRPVPWGVGVGWSDPEGNHVHAIDSDHN